MEFVKIEKGRYLSVPDMENIFKNFTVIKDLMTVKGYSTENLTILSYPITYTTTPQYIQYAMNMVEQNIQAIHKLLNFEDKFYKEFTWYYYGGNNFVDKNKEVHRWVDWQNNIYNILARPNAEYSPLVDINGNYITDINGAQIYAQKEQ